MLLLTDEEVAARLRCSPGKVARLRRSGKIPYIAGRPAKILESDLFAYIAEEKEKARCATKRPVLKPGSNAIAPVTLRYAGLSATLPLDERAPKAIRAGQKIAMWRKMRAGSSN